MRVMGLIGALLLAAPLGAQQSGALRVPGGEPAAPAFILSDLEIEPPAKRTEGAALARIVLTPARPGVVLREAEILLLYADRGPGGSGRFRRDAPQPRGLPKGQVRYAATPATARLGCMDALQPRQLVTIQYEENGVKQAQSLLVPFTWVDPFPTLSGRCHIPGR